MRVNPELLMIRKLNHLLSKYENKDSIPKNEIEEIQKDIEAMIKQEAQYSKFYLVTASDYIKID